MRELSSLISFWAMALVAFLLLAGSAVAQEMSAQEKATQKLYAKVQQAQAQVEAGKYAEACKTYDSCTKLADDEPVVWFLYGYALYLNDELDKSIACFEKVVDSNEVGQTALFNLGCAYSIKNETAKSLDYLHQSLDAGYESFDSFKTDADLKNVRKTEGFKKILARLKNGGKRPGEQNAKQKLKPKQQTKPETKSTVSSPTKGVSSDQIEGVVYDFGKHKLKLNHRTWQALPVWSGNGVYIVFKDGSACYHPSVPPSDLDVEKSKREEPRKWKQWKKVKLHAGTRVMKPLPAGYTLDIYVQRPTTTSTRTTVRTVWKSLKLTKKGRFETSRTSISSTQHDNDHISGPTTRVTSSSSKDGSFSSIAGNFESGGGMIRSQGTSKKTGNKGNHSGTYYIEGNTIELRYDNGNVARAVFGYDGKKNVVFGSTVYW